MAMSVKFSAVIPAFNREKTIGRAIESVLAQEIAPAELLVVDDGSSDRTAAVVGKYGPKLRLLKQKHTGVSAARNHGVREARNEWIAFLDSDDYWLSGHLTRMVEVIEATKGAAAVYFADLMCPPGDGTRSYWQKGGFQPKTPFELRHDAADWATMQIHPMMFQASVISRRHYLESGALPETLQTREDTFLFSKLGLLHPMCAVAGCGTAMMADGGHRLGDELNFRSVGYCRATVFVYKQLLEMTRSIGHPCQKVFADGVCRAYFGMARALYRDRAYGSSFGNLLLSGLRNPRICAESLLGTIRRRAVGPRQTGVLASKVES